MKRWIGFILLLVLVAAALFSGIRYFDQPEDLDDFQLRLDGVLVDSPEVFVKDTDLYLSIDLIREIPGITFFEEEDRVHLFSASRLNQLTIRGEEMTLNHQRVEGLAPYWSNETLYLPVGSLQDELDLAIDWNYRNAGAAIQSLQQPYQEYWVKSTTRLREKPSVFSDALEMLSPMSRVFVFEVPLEEGNWLYVTTASGRAGYVKREQLDWQTDVEVVNRQPKRFGEPILLAWDYFNENTALTYKLKPAVGLNILSPTWFSLEKEGNALRILDMANPAYREWAGQQGYEVWGLFKNAFNPDWTKELVRNPDARYAIQREMIQLAQTYGLGGINLDFENIYEEDRDYLSQFVREFYVLTREADLYLSMDVTRPGGSANWSLCYDRGELIQSLDYMMLMAYDEYYANGGVSGPVASMPWTEESVLMMLEEVPADQLVLGIPLYSRRWQEPLNGSGSVRSKALTLNGVETVIEERGLVPVWDPNAKQFKVSYEEDDSLFQIWLEDEISLFQRVSLIHDYQLAGFAAWRKGFEQETTWHTLYGFLSSGD